MALEIISADFSATSPIDPDRTLSFQIQQAGLSLDLQCSGLGICGKCAVELGPGEYLISGKIKQVKAGETLKALACQTKVLSSNATVSIPQKAILRSTGKIYDDFKLKDFQCDPLTKKFKVNVPEATLENPYPDWERLLSEIRGVMPDVKLSCSLEVLRELPIALKKSPELTVTLGRFRGQWLLIDIDTEDSSKCNLAVAVDIGTTTVACVLIDMNNAKIITRASSYNQQMSRADDVASRISVASSGPEMGKYMKDLIVNDTINPLIRELCDKSGCDSSEILRLAVSGNTVMSHLFLGLSPESIGSIPFQAVTNTYADAVASDIGLEINPRAIIKIVPSISGYIGGDITSDLYVSGMLETPELSALVDLGTNSEMVLNDAGNLFAAAAAAGPAFEGAGILCGCRATTGAIERIEFESDLNFIVKTIEDAAPIGICGSAIIDFIACGLACGLINNLGRYDLEMLRETGKYKLVETSKGEIHACVLVAAAQSSQDEDIVVTEYDLEQILKAKAAVYAGLKTLLSERGKTFADLKRLILAGGFAKYIDLSNAIKIGMLPETASEITEVIGNGSLAGAYLILLDPVAKKAFHELIKIPKITPLNTIPDFEMNFVDAMLLPNLNENEFPKTMASLAKR